MTYASPLFAPFQLGGLHLPNRIVMAPMTRCLSPGGVPGADVAAYYRRRAEGGVGLIVAEGTWIDHPGASNLDDAPHFHGEAALAGWKRVVTEVHAAGGLIMPQLWHAGLMRTAELDHLQGTPDGLRPDQCGPSGIVGGLGVTSEKIRPPMTEQAIADVIASFARAAADALRLGFDGIELHGAHGYLIDQFLWAETNHRADGYGGNPANRARFAADIVKAARKATNPDFPIILRISQFKQSDFAARIADTPTELEALLRPIVDAGLDAFHCSQRRFWEPAFPGSDLNLAGWVKKVTGLPVITVGSVSLGAEMLASFAGAHAAPTGVEALSERLAQGEFDLVAVGRALVSNPDWPLRVEQGLPLLGFDKALLSRLD